MWAVGGGGDIWAVFQLGVGRLFVGGGVLVASLVWEFLVTADLLRGVSSMGFGLEIGWGRHGGEEGCSFETWGREGDL